MQEGFSYILFSSPLGPLGIVWREDAVGPKVHRVLLPNEASKGGQAVRGMLPGAREGSNPAILDLRDKLQAYLVGEAVLFDVNMLALDICPKFQQRVLLTDYGIPRGWVSTYGRIAARLGTPGAARAVGSALARNPFPLVIPCHRTVRSDGALGGYRGGLPMKRTLLEMEGVLFLPSGKVRMEKVYY